MKSREEILDLLAQEKPELEKRYQLRRLALFGSYARGDQTERSDLDILVDVHPSIGLKFVSLAEDLERLLGTRVEVVSIRAIKPRNWKTIESELIDVK
jgi:predicted nucleotidyltransferase